MIKSIIVTILLLLFIGIVWLSISYFEQDSREYAKLHRVIRDEPEPISMRIIQKNTAEENLEFTTVNYLE